MTQQDHETTPGDSLPQLFEKAGALADKYGDEAQRQRLAEEATHHRDQALYLVVAGECTRGKSSLVNALLDEPELCPVDAPAVTNALTLVKWGDPERIFVHLRDGEHETVEEISRGRIWEYVTVQHNQTNAKNVSLLEIHLPHERLEGGLVIIDTPGLGTLNPLHAATTFSIAPNADGVVFVSSADRQLTHEEVEWAGKLVRRPEAFLHVVTHRDCVPEWESILQANVTQLAHQFNRPPEALAAVAVSNTLKQKAAASGSDRDLQRSGFPELDRELRMLLARSHSLLAMRAAKAIAEVCAAIKEPLEAEVTALSAATRESVGQLRGQLAQRRAELAKFEEDRMFWSQLVQRQSSEMLNACVRWLKEEFGRLRNKVDTDYLERRSVLNNPDTLQGLLSADMGRLAADLQNTTRSELAKVYERICAQTGLDVLLSYEYVRQELNPAITKNVKLGALDQLIVYGRGTMGVTLGLAGAGAATGAVLGGIVGTFVAPGVGTYALAALGAKFGGAVAGLVGSVIGFFRGFKTLQDAKSEKIKKVLYPQLNSLQTELEMSMREATTACVSTLGDAFSNAVHERRKSLKESIDRIEAALKKTDEEARQRLRELSEPVFQLNSVIRQCELLADRALSDLAQSQSAAC